MLVAPNVGEEEPPHVRHRGHLRFLVLGVITPHEDHHLLHKVVVHAGLVGSPDGENEVVCYPMLHRIPQNVFVESRQKPATGVRELSVIELYWNYIGTIPLNSSNIRTIFELSDSSNIV